MQRIYDVWCAVDGDAVAGGMTLKAFLVGVAIVAKGTHEEHLRFVFQLMDTTESQALCKKDAMTFLSAIADCSNVVAIETRSDTGTSTPWTPTALAELLHPTVSERLTPSKFVKVLSTKRFSTLYLTEWLPRFATQFRLAAATAGSPVVSPCTSPTTATAAQQRPRTSHSECAFRPPIGLPTSTFAALRSEFHDILDYLVNTGESLDLDTFMQRLDGIVSDKVLAAVRKVDVIAPVLASDTHEHKHETLVSRQGRQASRRWVLAVPSAFARDATGVLRLLFAMLDDDSKGAIDALQFAAFLRFSSCLNQAESERQAFSLVERICRSSSSASPPVSPTASQISTTVEAPRISAARFVELMHGASYVGNAHIFWGDVEIARLISHLALLDDAGDAQFVALQSIKQCTTQLRLAKAKTPTHDSSFCLMPRRQWNQIISVTCNDNDDEKDATTVHEALAKGAGVPLTEPKHEDRVLVPLSLWIVLCFWQRHRTHMEQSDWKQWMTRLDMPLYGDEAAFRGFCVSINLQWVAVDGIERRCAVPYSVASESSSIQDLVDALQFPVDAASKSTKARPVTIPEPLLCVPVSELLSSIGANHYGSIHQLELHVSVTDLMEPRSDSSDEVPHQHKQKKDVNISPRRSQLRRATRLHASTGQQCPVHGLANLGNTCFMNSALQCLAATPLLREYFLHHEYLYDLVAHLPAGGMSHGKQLPAGISPSALFLPLAFGQLVAEMNAFSSLTTSVSGVCDAITPEEMQRAIALLFPQLSDGTQQDAQEFLSPLLCSLGDELKRRPARPQGNDRATENSSGIDILSPQSRAFLAQLPSFPSRTREDDSGTSTASPETSVSAAAATGLRFQVRDSDGRPDAEVAREWWIAHLLNEPSICSALLCGQFKSALVCDVCGATSARFEPFASLQLPLQTIAVVVLLNPAKPSKNGSPGMLRLVVRAEMDWTLEQLFLRLQHLDHHSVSHSKNHHSRKSIVGVVGGCCISEYVDHDTLLATLPSPVDVFELGSDADDSHQDGERAARPVDRRFHAGDELLVWTADDRLVKAIVTLAHDPPSPRSQVGPEHPQRSLSPVPSAQYDVVLNEDLRRGVTMRHVARVQPVGTKRSLVICIIHRREVLVPFYCTSPRRLAPCGSPTIRCAQSTSATGKSLYRFVQQRFLRAATSHTSTAFVLRRVRGDGKCCARCHWTTKRVGRLVPRTNALLENLEMDETIAIDWMPTKDDESYVQHRQTHAQSLTRSLEVLCDTEKIDATCARCQQQRSKILGGSCSTEGDQSGLRQSKSALSPHTKQISLWSVPPILIVQLKRFELGPGYVWEKARHCVDFPIECLNLAPSLSGSASQYCSAATSEPVQRAAASLQQDLQFPLETASRACTGHSVYAIVNHMGGTGFGHYTARIKHSESGEWWLVDDASATPAAVETLTPSAAAYLLLYVRHDVVPPPPRADESAAAESSKVASGGGMQYGQMRLSSFYPRQNHASRPSEATIHDMRQHETWTHAASSSGQLAKNKRENTHGKCNFM